jgi:hypothetical protein
VDECNYFASHDIAYIVTAGAHGSGLRFSEAGDLRCWPTPVSTPAPRVTSRLRLAAAGALALAAIGAGCRDGTPAHPTAAVALVDDGGAGEDGGGEDGGAGDDGGGAGEDAAGEDGGAGDDGGGADGGGGGEDGVTDDGGDLYDGPTIHVYEARGGGCACQAGAPGAAGAAGDLALGLGLLAAALLGRVRPAQRRP